MDVDRRKFFASVGGAAAVAALSHELLCLCPASIPMPTSLKIAVLACDVVCDERQEALGGARQGELLALDAGRVRPALPARDQGTARLHALRLQEGRGAQEL